MKHKDKLKLARKMTGKTKGVFETPEWTKRAEGIQTRVKNKLLKTQKRVALTNNATIYEN